jgi:hypothetical protein
LLASARGGVDQSPTLRKRTPSSYFGKGRLMGGRGVIFPGSYRSRELVVACPLEGLVRRRFTHHFRSLVSGKD